MAKRGSQKSRGRTLCAVCVCLLVGFSAVVILSFDYTPPDIVAQRSKKLQQSVKLDDFVNIVNTFEMSALRQDIEKIAVVRPVGSPGHQETRDFLKRSCHEMGWQTDLDQFSEVTPIGMKDFANVVCTFRFRSYGGPGKRLVLGAHYDTKYYREPNTFVGAIDSVVPCAMLLDIGRAITPVLSGKPAALPELNAISQIFAEIKDTMRVTEVQLVFFDGEEAFEEWTSADSLYGSRHLVNVWGNTKVKTKTQGVKDGLQMVDMLVLLDLIGSPMPALYNYVEETTPTYEWLMKIESHLTSQKLLSEYKVFEYFRAMRRAMILDDHIPFMQRGVPVLLVAPTPFPTVWHTNDDTVANIEMNSVADLCKIFRVFVLYYVASAL